MAMRIPWLTLFKKELPQEDPADVLGLLAILTRHVYTQRLVLHRIDAWILPWEGHTVTLTRPVTKFTVENKKLYPVPLRIGDVLCYNLSFLPALTHTMVYVGAGYVVHFLPKMAWYIFRRSPPRNQQEVTLDHIHAFTPSQRARMYVCAENGYTRLPRYRVALRALATVGTYPDLKGGVNCQHVVESILGNESFSIGIPRLAAPLVVVAAGAVVIFLLVMQLRQLPCAVPAQHGCVQT